MANLIDGLYARSVMGCDQISQIAQKSLRGIGGARTLYGIEVFE